MKQVLFSLIRRAFGHEAVGSVVAPRLLTAAELRFVAGGDGGTDAPRTTW